VARRRPPDERDTVVDAKKTRRGVVDDSKRAARDAELVGSMFGPYLIEQHLGGGAMGVVYRASHIDTNRIVAMKILRAHLLEERETVARFHREARLASRIGHPHVGGVFELVQAGGRQGLAMELVEGEPLSSIMTMPLPPERVTLLVAQLLKGLEHAHAMGLVHRDLKPDNVLVEWRNGRDHARIIDFGIAIAQEGSPESVARLTGSGQIIGTPAYMSPEQARAESVDQRSDFYSLGAIMYEMLTGKLPFDGRPADVVLAKLKHDPPTFEQRAPGIIVDPLLTRFCFKLLARRPDDRFATARQALTTLEQLATNRDDAGVTLGIMDTKRAMDVVWLPDVPKR
jgi:eukaryotic-like serine/threonine-protein kinase